MVKYLFLLNTQDNLPKFLVSSGSTQTNSGAQLKEKQDRERKRRMKNMAKMAYFCPAPSALGGFTIKTSLESVQE